MIPSFSVRVLTQLRVVPTWQPLMWVPGLRAAHPVLGPLTFRVHTPARPLLPSQAPGLGLPSCSPPEPAQLVTVPWGLRCMRAGQVVPTPSCLGLGGPGSRELLNKWLFG